MEDHRAAATEFGGGGMGLSTSGDIYRGGRIRGDRGQYPKEAEHSCAKYCDATDSRPLQAIDLKAGGLGLLQVVGTGGD